MNYHGRRRCGSGRNAGAIYNSIDSDQYGQPLPHFLFDPPQVMRLEDLGLTSIGTRVVDFGGAYHICDVVGQESYPFVPDFLEEANAFGFSRLLQKNLDWSKLTSASRHLLLHAKASIVKPEPVFQERVITPFNWSTGGCPKPEENPTHHTVELAYSLDNNIPLTSCLGLCWETMKPARGERIEDRIFTRQGVPGVKFQAAVAPEGIEAVEFEIAAFAWLPVRLEVIYDHAYGTHEDALAILEQFAGGLPYKLVDDEDNENEDRGDL
jgi:hypothetical protein